MYITHMYISVIQGTRRDFADPWLRVSEGEAGLCPHMETWLGEDLLLNSFRLLAESISLWLQDWWFQFIAQLLETAHDSLTCELLWVAVYFMTACSGEREQRGQVSQLARRSLTECNGTTGMTSHHICHILLVWIKLKVLHTLVVRTTPGSEHPEARSWGPLKNLFSIEKLCRESNQGF